MVITVDQGNRIGGNHLDLPMQSAQISFPSDPKIR